MTLNSDLVSIIIVSGAYLLYYWRYWNHTFGVLMYLGMTKGCILFSGFCDLTADLISRINISGAHLLY